ncbi:helix-turn-helix domain-containing protein [Pelagibius sp.]|uniref:TetR/AcrR family transcriptional regulator n=1 Tax=Pelagibius sp. TaxID=1931238 RepID=UPI003BB2207C
MNDPFIHNKHRSAPASRRGPKRDPQKLAAIGAAARHVLTAQGPRLTQVADVAREAGVAAGTVYIYVAEKDALIELALLSAARCDLPPVSKPVRFNAARLRRVAESVIAKRFQWPALKAAVTETPTAQTLRDVLAETFDMLAREKLLIGLLDRCSREVTVLENLYIKGARHRFYVDFESCLRRLSTAGHLRGDLDLAAAARASLEMLVWMAMRRRGDPEPPSCDDIAARDTSISLLIQGLAAR